MSSIDEVASVLRDAVFDSILESAEGRPAGGDCNPEVCPKVADLFDEIADTLAAKSDPAAHRSAMWDAHSFSHSANVIRANVESASRIGG